MPRSAVPRLLFLLALASCSGSEDDDGQAERRSLPTDFVLGVGYSAYQAEGNSHNNDWDAWNRAGHGKDQNDFAANSYVLYDLDAKLAAEVGAQAFRIGIEWARVEPRRGVWDEKEIAHYRDVMESIRTRGLVPYVTLWHFTNPLWMAEGGAWKSQGGVDRFVEYAAEMARRYGDIVDQWITLNEPTIYASGTCLANLFPGGGYLDVEGMKKVLSSLVFAHARAFDAIRANDTVDADGDGKPSTIAFVNATSPYFPIDPESARDAEATLAYDWVMNRLFFEAVVRGNLDVNLDGDTTDRGTTPPEGHHPELEGRLDYVGINYYTRQPILAVPLLLRPLNGVPCVGTPGMVFCPGIDKSGPRGTNGSEVYPPGIYEVIAELAGYGLPMMITENGVATPDGSFRARYVVQHLAEVLRAIRDGYDVRGYLHWALIDNFEWLEGFRQRFGLYTVDYSTFARTINEGGEVFRRIATDRAIPKDLLARHAFSNEPAGSGGPGEGG